MTDSTAAINYLSRYVRGSAILDQRIVSDDGHKVVIRMKDYRTGKRKLLTLPGEEFVHRFATHILPARFQRIRHAGLFGSRQREENLATCRRLLGCEAPAEVKEGASDEGATSETEQEAEGVVEEVAVDPSDTSKAQRSFWCPRCRMLMEPLGRLSARETEWLLRAAAIFWRRVYWHADISAAPGPLTRPLDAALEPLVCWTVAAVPVLPACSQFHTLPPPDT